MRDNSRRVGTHEKNSGDANCRLGTITQSIFCPVRSQHSLNRFEMVCLKSLLRGRDPLNQNFRKFQSKTHWIGSVQPEKFRKNGSTFWSGPGPVGILFLAVPPVLENFRRPDRLPLSLWGCESRHPSSDLGGTSSFLFFSSRLACVRGILHRQSNNNQ